MATQAVSRPLIETATRQFAELGFDGVTLWDIARTSGVTMAYIATHYGGKKELYLACADHIAAQIRASHEASMGGLHAHPPANAEEAKAHLVAMLEDLAHLMLSPQTDAWQQFLLREQLQPTEAYDHLYNLVIGPLFDISLNLMAVARPSLSDEARRAQNVYVVAMALMLSLARATVCRVMNVEKIDAAVTDTLLAELRRAASRLISEG